MTTEELQRLLPQAPDTEKALLSAYMLSPRDVGSLCVERGVSAGYFHIPAHSTIYRVLSDLWNDNKHIDSVVLRETLRERNLLKTAGGLPFLTDLSTYIPTAALAGQYIDTLQERLYRREMIRICGDYVSRSYFDKTEAGTMLADLEANIFALRRCDDSELREREPKELVMEVVQRIESFYENRGKINGLPTGFKELDDMLDGLHPQEMIVIAARPSMGKTAFAMTMAEHIALEQNKTIAFFTLEMSDTALMQRALLSKSRVNMHRVRQGFLTEGDFPAITAAASRLAESNRLRIIDAVGASIGAIRAKARRLARRFPDLGAIFVDYIQKARSNSRQAMGSREREIAEISSGLKDMAKELNVPVVVLAQLNREVEKRKGGGRPQLSDLRESGAIEQDADVVGLLYREEYYAANEEEKRQVEGEAVLIIAKQRNGPVGDVPLTFLKEFARYETRAREFREDPYAGKRRN